MAFAYLAISELVVAPRKIHGAPLTADYFFDRSIPEPNSGCWIWLKGLSADGYGVINVVGHSKGAHRACYEIVNGIDLPSSIFVCHSCDNRCCVNPDHLFEGTNADNMADCARKKRFNSVVGPGELAPNSKLRTKDVIAIRSAKGVSQRALGRQYGVTQRAIGLVLSRKTWGHIP